MDTQLSEKAIDDLRIVFERALTEPQERLTLLNAARNQDMNFRAYYSPNSQCGCVWGTTAIIKEIYAPPSLPPMLDEFNEVFDSAHRTIWRYRNEITQASWWETTDLEGELLDLQMYESLDTACEALVRGIESLIDEHGELKVVNHATD